MNYTILVTQHNDRGGHTDLVLSLEQFTELVEQKAEEAKAKKMEETKKAEEPKKASAHK